VQKCDNLFRGHYEGDCAMQNEEDKHLPSESARVYLEKIKKEDDIAAEAARRLFRDLSSKSSIIKSPIKAEDKT
jgi:hypothetical protein